MFFLWTKNLGISRKNDAHVINCNCCSGILYLVITGEYVIFYGPKVSFCILPDIFCVSYLSRVCNVFEFLWTKGNEGRQQVVLFWTLYFKLEYKIHAVDTTANEN